MEHTIKVFSGSRGYVARSGNHSAYDDGPERTTDRAAARCALRIAQAPGVILDDQDPAPVLERCQLTLTHVRSHLDEEEYLLTT